MVRRDERALELLLKELEREEVSESAITAARQLEHPSLAKALGRFEDGE